MNMQLNLNKIYLETYDKNNNAHEYLIKQFANDSYSSFISMIDSRLRLNSKQKTFPFDTAFIVYLYTGEILGYVFISGVRNDEVYLEYSILKDKRNKGYGKLTLELVTNYLFINYNIKDIALDIDVSNEASMKTTMSCGYYEDEYVDNGRLIYKNYNLSYVTRRKK